MQNAKPWESSLTLVQQVKVCALWPIRSLGSLSLVAELERVILDRSISQSDAQRLRGRMQFAESQLYGRTGKRCTRALREAVSRRRHRFAEHELFALNLFSKLLQHGNALSVGMKGDQ